MLKRNWRLIILLTAVGLAACSDKTPEIKLAAIDCPKDKIAIDATSTFVADSSGSGGTVTVTVSVTCDGVAVSNFEVEVTVPGWTGISKKFKGDSAGKLKKQFKLGSDQKGNKVKVRVTGSDGDKTVEVTIR